MTATPSRPARRLSYIDWMRGLAILIMIEAHTLDSWTLTADRYTEGFRWSVILAGFAAPMFLFLSGLSVSLAASSGERKTGSAALSARHVRRRGWEIFGLAYLFRIQAYILNPKAMLSGMLKVDILNIMGPAIVATSALWHVAGDYRRRLGAFAAAALAITLTTPLVRTSTLIDRLPPFLQWYLRATPGKNNFQIFPWAGFVFAGAFVGVLVERARSERQAERRLHGWMLPCGLAFAAACYAGSFLPSIYADSNFWTSSPMFFLLRVGIISATLSAVYFWEQRPRLLGAWPAWQSPMAVFGQASLFVYWVHVELAYGVFSTSLHKNLPLPRAVVAFAWFSLAMFGLVLVKNLCVARWKQWRAAVPAAAPSMVEKA